MIQIRFLLLDDFKRVFLFGYELSLSPSEYRILRALAEQGELSAALLAELASLGGGSDSLAVHISSINGKAKKISERRLIVCRDSQYSINEMM